MQSEVSTVLEQYADTVCSIVSVLFLLQELIGLSSYLHLDFSHYL